MSSHPHQLRDAVLTLAGIGVILALLRLSASIVEPILLSLLIVAIASPPLGFMRRRGVPTGVSLGIGLAAIVAVLGLSSILLSGALARFGAGLPEFEQKLLERSAGVDEWFAGKGIDLHKGGVLHHFSPERVAELVESILAHMGSALSDTLLILFIVIFMLAEATQFPRKARAVFGSDDPMTATLATLLIDVNRYASTKAMVSTVTGILIWIGLRIFGLDYAGLWAFLAFLLNFIPNLGSIIAAVPAVLVAMLHGSPLYVGGIVALYVGVNVVVGNVIEPIVVGRRLGLSAVSVLLSLVFWGWMFGIVGMLVSVPLSMTVRALAATYPPTRWLATLMGPLPDDPPPTTIDRALGS